MVGMLVWAIEIILLCSYFEGQLQTGNNGMNCFTGVEKLIAVVITGCSGKPPSYPIMSRSECCYNNCLLLKQLHCRQKRSNFKIDIFFMFQTKDMQSCSKPIFDIIEKNIYRLSIFLKKIKKIFDSKDKTQIS